MWYSLIQARPHHLWLWPLCMCLTFMQSSLFNKKIKKSTKERLQFTNKSMYSLVTPLIVIFTHTYLFSLPKSCHHIIAKKGQVRENLRVHVHEIHLFETKTWPIRHIVPVVSRDYQPSENPSFQNSDHQASTMDQLLSSHSWPLLFQRLT